MPVEKMVLEKLRSLPPEQQREVLHFIEFLAQRQLRKAKQQNIAGLWADLSVDLTEEDITEARREMWAAFSAD